MNSLSLLAALLCALSAAHASDQHDISEVHLIFSNHLDIGFHSNLDGIPGTDAAVLTRYFRDYFPAAIATANALRQRGGRERFRYLTHSFLVSFYLDCPSKIGVYCPTDEEIADFKAAIFRGDIVWHAFPHNAQIEFMDSDLLVWALELTHKLDQQFGLEPKQTMSQRDVPGLTRAAIPAFAGAGVTALSLGVNGGSAPPSVPHNTPFIWKDERTNTSILAFVHPGGYSGYPVDSREECVTAKGLRAALCSSWRGDNAGPHSPEEVLEVYATIRKQFPEAQSITASTLDDFVSVLESKALSLDLPIVTKEIGDTWIHGVASDPGKVAAYRALLRVRRDSRDRWDDPVYYRFSRLLLKISEHTWGVDTKEYPGDYFAWSNADLAEVLNKGDEKFLAAVASWERQRMWTEWAAEEVGEARNALVELQGVQNPPATLGPLFSLLSIDHLTATSEEPVQFTSRSWDIKIDPKTGALAGLTFLRGQETPKVPVGSKGLRKNLNGIRNKIMNKNNYNNKNALPRLVSWASPDGLLAKLQYSTYSEASYDVIWKEYAYQTDLPEWFYKDFGKPNATRLGGAVRRDAEPKLKNLWHRELSGGGVHIIAEGVFDQELVDLTGAPQKVYLEIQSLGNSDDLLVDVVLENKTATRLPEAMWLSWRPDRGAVDPSTWTLSKLGQPISPLEVIRNGSMSMHAVDDDGVSVLSADGTARLSVWSLDAALVSPGDPTPFPNTKNLPDLSYGVSFCLHNNIWGTNYVMWWPYRQSDATVRYRFIVQVEEVVKEQQGVASE